jgi:dATP pyrophosphohydrolase
MARAPFQVLIFPYIKDRHGLIVYAVFRRSDGHYWQAIAGGGEKGETPQEAAVREAQEEAGIQGDCEILTLDSKACIPAIGITDEHTWGDTHAIPEYAFTVRVDHRKLKLSNEHI